MLLSVPAFAQQELPAQVYACAGIENASQRHACFDGLVPELRMAGSQAAATKPPSAEPDRSPLTAPVLSAAEAAAVRVAPRENEVDRIALGVTAIGAEGDGKYRFTMENGQIWRQLDTVRLRNLGKGPWRAEIRKAALGSYLLTLDGQRASVRVERLN